MYSKTENVNEMKVIFNWKYKDPSWRRSFIAYSNEGFKTLWWNAFYFAWAKKVEWQVNLWCDST